MNASDIVKAKQNQTLYKAYYKPTVFNSTIYSTIIPVSSSNTVSPSFTSCLTTVYDYTCNPQYGSYDMINHINDGKYVCGGKVKSETEWKANTSTIVYAYKTIMSSFDTPEIPKPYSTQITSTILMTAPTPVITPLINFYQGTHSVNLCEVCNNFNGPNTCCNNCASGYP